MTLMASASPGDQTVNAWMKRMVQAAHALNYEGTFIYLHGNQLESMRIIHSAEEGRERERLVSLNGAAREVIREDGAVICVLPDAKAVSVLRHQSNPGSSPILPMNLNELSGYYDFRLLGDARVAGRRAKIVAIIPRDAYRYGYRFYLDVEHALPLKTDTLDESGRVVAQIMFTTLRVDPSIRDGLPAMPAVEKDFAWTYHNSAHEMPASDPADWTFSHLPAGFQLRVRARRPGMSANGEIRHFVFSDGLATLSIYIEKAGEVSRLHGESHMGAMSAFGTRIADYQVVVVGEVPIRTVRYVAGAIEYSGKRQ